MRADFHRRLADLVRGGRHRMAATLDDPDRQRRKLPAQLNRQRQPRQTAAEDGHIGSGRRHAAGSSSIHLDIQRGPLTQRQTAACEDWAIASASKNGQARRQGIVGHQRSSRRARRRRLAFELTDSVVRIKLRRCCDFELTGASTNAAPNKPRTGRHGRQRAFRFDIEGDIQHRSMLANDLRRCFEQARTERVFVSADRGVRREAAGADAPVTRRRIVHGVVKLDRRDQRRRGRPASQHM